MKCNLCHSLCSREGEEHWCTLSTPYWCEVMVACRLIHIYFCFKSGWFGHAYMLTFTELHYLAYTRCLNIMQSVWICWMWSSNKLSVAYHLHINHHLAHQEQIQFLDPRLLNICRTTPTVKKINDLFHGSIYYISTYLKNWEGSAFSLTRDVTSTKELEIKSDFMWD